MMSSDKSYIPSKIELAKALREVKAIAKPEQYQEVHRVLTAERADDFGSAIEGLTEEDDFALTCVLMGTATHLAPVEQRLAVAGGHAAPDILVRFQPGFYQRRIPNSRHTGFRCFVEVKATTKDKLRIGGNQLRKLRAFADAFGMPLLLAVRFRWFNSALWVMVQDNDRSKRSVTIGVSDWPSGLRPVLWDEHGYMLLPGTYFQATYDGKSSGRNLYHRKYGEQIGFQIATQEERYALSGDDAGIAAALFECYNLEEIESKRQGELTHVLYRARNLVVSVADLIYGMNRLPRDEHGNPRFDAAKVVRQMADGQRPTLIGRDFVEYFADRLCDLGVLGRMGYGDPQESYRKWLLTGGTDAPASSEGRDNCG